MTKAVQISTEFPVYLHFPKDVIRKNTEGKMLF